MSRVVLRWRRDIAAEALTLGDAWERSYGDLQWRHHQPERVLPWYWLANHDSHTTGMGVRVRPGALCSWTVDTDGVSLWLDVRSGASPVELGGRVLEAATVVAIDTDTTTFAAHQELCDAMSDEPLPLPRPVVGCNNWYYAYGENFGPEAILRDAHTITSYADGHHVRTYCVIDDGWTGRGGPWNRGLPGVFDDMPGLAAEISSTGARPGLWYRPLLNGTRLDPSLPSTLDSVAEDIARYRSWGCELIVSARASARARSYAASAARGRASTWPSRTCSPRSRRALDARAVDTITTLIGEITTPRAPTYRSPPTTESRC